MAENQAAKFGAWIREQRLLARMTIEELAKKTGISKQHLSVLERAVPHSLTGKPVQIKVQAVDALAAALDLDINEARRAAGYAAATETAADRLAAELARSVMASGFDDLEDESLRQAFLEDMKTIAESMLKRKLEEQNKGRNEREPNSE